MWATMVQNGDFVALLLFKPNHVIRKILLAYLWYQMTMHSY